MEELWESIRQDANVELSDAHKKLIEEREEGILSGKAKLLRGMKLWNE